MVETADAVLNFNETVRRENSTDKQVSESFQKLKELGLHNSETDRLLKSFAIKEGKELDAISTALKDGDSGLKERLLEHMMSDVDKSTSTLRVSRIVRDLSEKSTPEEWKTAREKLDSEEKAGNKVAKEWHQWAGAQEVVANISLQLSDPAKTMAAVKKLADMAGEGKNEYARFALSSLVLAGSGQDNINAWVQSNNGGLKEKPAYVADLATALKDNPALLREIQATALRSFTDLITAQSKPLEKGEAQALALAYARINSESKEARAGEIAGSIEAFFRKNNR